jgi:hypothetical protein
MCTFFATRCEKRKLTYFEKVSSRFKKILLCSDLGANSKTTERPGLNQKIQDLKTSISTRDKKGSL